MSDIRGIANAAVATAVIVGSIATNAHAKAYADSRANASAHA